MRKEPWIVRLVPKMARLLAVLMAVASFLVLTDAANAALTVTGRRTALVIGNSHYKALPQLPNAVNDANRIKEVLERANFDVVVGEDLDGKGLEKIIRDFLRSLNDGDVALFYYSGHAAQVAGDNYIFPVDASLTSSYDLEVQAYNVSNLLDYMRQSSSLQIAILDACRDNPFKNGFYYVGNKKVDVSDVKGLAPTSPGLGSLIVYSTAPDQVAYDGGGKISPFTGSFADNALTPNTEVREIITRVRNEVISYTDGRQVPWDVSSLTTSFFFVQAQDLIVMQDETDVKIPSDTAGRVALNIPMPVAGGGMTLSVRLLRVPDRGTLWVGANKVGLSSKLTAEQLADLAYEPDRTDRTAQQIAYAVTSSDGKSSNGNVNITFDAAAPPPAVAADEPKGGDGKVQPLLVAMASDVGTGFASIPNGALSAVQSDAGWLRLAEHDSGTLVALGDQVVSSGDLVRAADVGRLTIRPSIATAGEKLGVTLVPAVQNAKMKPVAISVAVSVNKCDEMAAEPFDIQGVSEGVLPNEIRMPAAKEACQQAVEQYPDIARFKYEYGRTLYADSDFDGAIKQFKAAYDQGHVRAGYMLGRFLQLGVGGSQRDPAKAIPYFEAGTEKGDPYAQYSLGRALVSGNGVAPDVSRGIELETKAAESGHTYAMNQLGFEYKNGTNVPQDLGRALAFFEKSVSRGDVYGMINLGLLYRDGKGVDKDSARALDLFQQAEKGGQPEAGTLVGLLLLDTGNASPEEVMSWYRRSAELGSAWSATVAADFIVAHPDLGKDPGEAIRYYALAASLNVRDISDNARKALEKSPDKAVAAEVQSVLVRMGQDVGKIDGKLGAATRKAAVAVLGADAPKDPRELLIQLIRREWIASRPRLDML